MNKEYTIVTISNRSPMEWYYLQKEFYKSLEGENVMTIVPEYWGGLMTKPRTLHKLISEGGIKTDYIIFPDNWDLVFAESGAEIMERFSMFDSDVVISAEKNCFPADLKDEYDKLHWGHLPYRYLNSGFIVGSTDAIFECLEDMDLPSIPNDYYDNERNCNVHPNDQLEWMKVFLRQPVKMELDANQYLCQTLHGIEPDEFDFSGEKILNKVTDVHPASFHFNGGGKSGPCRNPILTHLNLI